ncbi:uncharacterized protein [Rutidosis leptorrhynchoides]|uniref:uncharacterized protein n=1 Tax=Rutidosis leptorrhynchoides TaxID=125765 RepID=UPI003A99AD8E
MKILSLNIRGLGLYDKNKFNWFKCVCFQQKPNVIALQETKAEKISETWVEKVWGCNDFKYAFKKSKGTELILVNTYGPQTDSEKRKMWDDLNDILKYDDAMWIIFGDFNEVRFSSERKNTDFCERRAKLFNDFIKDNSLLDLPLGGRTYTRITDNGRKFCKLDRYLVSENLFLQWPNLNVMVLDKKHTDHCPLILQDGNVDFGPKSVKVFDEWLKQEDSYDIIKSTWNKTNNNVKLDCIFRDKLKLVKQELKKWYSTSHGKLTTEIEELTSAVNDWEKIAELADLNEVQYNSWMKDKETLLQKEKTQIEMLNQKSRFKWVLEGDENSKFFHSYIRRRNQKNNIHGVNIGGVWNSNPLTIKK